MKFSIGRWLAIATVYGAYAALLHSFGAVGLAIGAVASTAICGLIVKAQRSDVSAILRTAVYALAGAFLGIGALSPLILRARHGYAHSLMEALESDIAGGFMGAIIGALAGSLITHLSTLPRGAPDTDRSQ